jgi:hypothetical protein
MFKKPTDPDNMPLKRMAEEEKIREKIDKNGDRWIKVYLGGGTHFQNWLNQVIELKGKVNIEIEEIDSIGYQCFAEGGEKMYRIWIKDNCENKDFNSDNEAGGRL